MTSPDGTPIYVGEGLGAAGAWLNGQAAEAVEELSNLKTLLAPLEETWRESQAAAFYTTMQTEWDISAAGLLGPDGVLGQIAAVMNINWNNYVNAETANIATWRH